jgi:hypothetical protein
VPLLIKGVTFHRKAGGKKTLGVLKSQFGIAYQIRVLGYP